MRVGEREKRLVNKHLQEKTTTNKTKSTYCLKGSSTCVPLLIFSHSKKVFFAILTFVLALVLMFLFTFSSAGIYGALLLF